MSMPNVTATPTTPTLPPAPAASGVPALAPTATHPDTAPGHNLQPQPSMLNKPPAEAASADADAASHASHSAQVLPSSVPHLVRERSEKQKLVRTATVTRSLYQIPATLKCAQLAELGKGTLTITVETRAQLAALCEYLQDGPALKDGTPVHALKLSCDFEKLAREKNSEWVAPGALLANLMDSALCVKSLDLGGCVLREADFKALGRSLSRPEWNLEALILDGCIIANDAAQELAKGLANHGSLKNFSLQGTYMLEPAWRSVLAALASCNKLETLVIHPTAAGNLPMDAMALVVGNVPSLRSLACSCAERMSLYPEQAAFEWRTGFGAFCLAVAQHPGLLALDLAGSQLSSADVGRLVQALEKNGSVEQLGLGKNQPDAQQAGKINTVLVRNAAANLRKAARAADAATTTTGTGSGTDTPSSTSSTSSSSASSPQKQ